MGSTGLLFALVAGLMTLTLPRAFALVPLLVAAAYSPAGETMTLLGANFSIPRLVIALGFARALARGEHMAGGWTRLDSLVLLWGALLEGSSLFHTDDAWMFRAGIVWTELGTYFLARRFMTGMDDVQRTIRALGMAVLPLALCIAYEKASGTNAFSVFDSVPMYPEVREGRIRAAGAFSHSILAGTVGSLLLGLALTQWKESAPRTLLAAAAGLVILVSSASSGPLLMTAAILFGYMLFGLRRALWPIQVGALLLIVGLDMAMNDPVYFLMAKIDLAGGSQGYFRAQLIRSSIEHLDEWWMAGTDYTRHWMQTGLKVSSRHTDITNHFLWQGVLGGFPLLFAFLAILRRAFANVGHAVKAQPPTLSPAGVRTTWGLGCVLFGLAVNSISVTMFDHSVMFFWLVVAMIATATSVPSAATAPAPAPAPVPPSYVPASVQFD